MLVKGLVKYATLTVWKMGEALKQKSVDQEFREGAKKGKQPESAEWGWKLFIAPEEVFLLAGGNWEEHLSVVVVVGAASRPTEARSTVKTCLSAISARTINPRSYLFLLSFVPKEPCGKQRQTFGMSKLANARLRKRQEVTFRGALPLRIEFPQIVAEKYFDVAICN
ncbi:ABC transporter, ATP-binding protein [Anopheles sinensis]|uniref:ABC transporter, ATP-binding protein n=1 Tax=Anopheles sinensis TaxID=74873 RepID=A0A084VTD2_ANOSI|nr:ABC transporter, ATP-binding protein [Anopheles sinensis]